MTFHPEPVKTSHASCITSSGLITSKMQQIRGLDPHIQSARVICHLHALRDYDSHIATYTW